MRYQTGPIVGTLVLSVLAVLGVVAEVAAGVRGQSVGSAIFGVAVILLFAGLAAVGLNDLRGVRTERRPDGSAVLALPRFIPRGGWWRVVPAEDIDTVFLVLVSSRVGRLYNLVVTLRDGTTLRSGAVAVNRPRRESLEQTKAGRMVEQIRDDLGLT